MSKFKKGDFAYIYANGWKKVCILRVLGNSYYHVCRTDRNTGFGTSEHRLMTETEYEAKYKVIEEEMHTIRAHPPMFH